MSAYRIASPPLRQWFFRVRSVPSCYVDVVDACTEHEAERRIRSKGIGMILGVDLLRVLPSTPLTDAT